MTASLQPVQLDGETLLVPIVGHPIGQVKSPPGVTASFTERGINAICIPMHVLPQDMAGFWATMRATRNVGGVIATVPHKVSAFEACDTVSERARFLRTVNTIVRRADGQLHGDMFDGLAHAASCVAKGCVFTGKRGLLAGTGGAGTAIAHAVLSSGLASLDLIDLDTDRRDELAARLRAAGFQVESISVAEAASRTYDTLHNATPMGMQPDDPLPLPASLMKPGVFVGDVVTRPAVPPLIATARGAGCLTSTGSEMFDKVRDLIVDFLADGIAGRAVS